ncbi:sensor histidine kinase [Planococcus sp. MERTA32b]|uniref:sensor histidine kinase n=1 Tax=Planomicrobium okeanokoites TaxID=244 RepID=UPI00248F9788|nr:sensor histidine kinase [Planomicrobium okeanokoites]MCM3611136.1 sensor histidine kinase [Planococcus sp. MER TA 32b]
MPPNTDFQSELMMKMYANSSEAIFFFDRDGKTLSLNPAAANIMENDVLEQLIAGADSAICEACRGFTSESENQTCKNCFFESVEPANFTSFQIHLKTKGKGVVPYTATFHTIDSERGIRVFMLRDLTTQFETQKKLHQNTMMRHVIEAQENERKRISRELHDSVAQELLSAVVELRALKYMTGDQKVLDKAEDTKATLTRLLDDIRNLSLELRPASLDDFGLEAAFRSHFKRIEESYGISIELVSSINKKRFDSEIETVFYRICQEAVLNSIKYAFVEEIKVHLYEEDSHLHLITVDEGLGFKEGQSPKGTGLGLFGMRERAELVNGKVEISSELGKGTTVHLSVPL